MELTHGGGLIEEMERRRTDHCVECAVVEGQLLSASLSPLHLGAPGTRLSKHPVGHVDPVHLVGVEFIVDPGSENSCAAGDIGDPAGAGNLQDGEYLILRGLVHQPL